MAINKLKYLVDFACGTGDIDNIEVVKLSKIMCNRYIVLCKNKCYAIR